MLSGLATSLLSVWRKNDYEFLPSLTKPEMRVEQTKDKDEEDEDGEDQEDFEGRAQHLQGLLPHFKKGMMESRKEDFWEGLVPTSKCQLYPCGSAFG